jgi:hypothetical protein
MNKERLASVLGRAVIDKEFAALLDKDPEAAVKSMGIHLNAESITAIREINSAKLTDVAAGLRGKLGTKAIFDQQQQQQARMD